MFKKAEKKLSLLRLALAGTSGSGKTWSALQIAKGLGGKIAVLDTERGSASLYSDFVDFDVVEMGPPYEPERFIEVIHAAEKEGYNVLILDSITHEWVGQGGVLEIVDALARSKYRNNSYAAWNEGTPLHQKFIDAMLGSKLHIIATMRSKAVYVETEKQNGKKAIEKQGSAPQQRDGLEYEFTVVLDLNVDGHIALASKDRTGLFQKPFVITEQTGKDLLDWLNSGKPVAQQPQAQPQQEAIYKPEPIPQKSAKNAQSIELRKEFCNIMAGRHNNDKTAIFSELSNFYGREISSTNDLADKEIQDFLGALKMPETEDI